MAGRELLERFRPASAPGAVARVGVPADTTEDAEVLAVLRALTATVSEANAAREQAHQTARDVLDEVTRQVRAIESAARLDAEEARATAAAQAREAGRREAERLLAEAEEQAAALRARADRDLPGVVDELLAALRETVVGPSAEVTG